MFSIKLNIAVFVALQFLSLQVFALDVGDSVEYYGAKGLVVGAEGAPLEKFVAVKFDIFEEVLIAPPSFFEFQNADSSDDGYIGNKVVEESLKKYFDSKKLGPFMITPFNGYLLPVRVKRGMSGVEVLIESTGRKPAPVCLLMRIELSEKRAHIAGILAQQSNTPVSCPLPIARRGTLLLDFVDELSASLRLEKVTLVDSSKRTCEANGKETSLRLLRIIQKGAGWYESHGYFAENHKEYRERVEAYLNYPIKSLEEETELWGTIYLSDIKAYLKASSSLHRSLVDIEPYLAEFSNYLNMLSNSIRTYRNYLRVFENNRRSDSVSEFLRWLWDTDCTTYTELDGFFEKSHSQSVFEFSRVRPVSRSLTKAIVGLK